MTTRVPLKYKAAKAAKKKQKFGPTQPHIVTRKDHNLVNILQKQEDNKNGIN